MKRLLALSLSILLIFTILVGCTPKNDEQDLGEPEENTDKVEESLKDYQKSLKAKIEAIK